MARLRFSPAFWLALQRIKELAKNQSGATAITVTLLASTLVGFAGLGTEVVTWYSNHRALQSAAIAAALSGAAANRDGVVGFSGNFANEVKYIVARYGFVAGQGGVSITVNSPPLSGIYRTVPGAVEVYIKMQQKPLFAGLFLKGTPSCGPNPADTKAYNFCHIVRAVAGPATISNGCQIRLLATGLLDVPSAPSSDGGRTIELRPLDNGATASDDGDEGAEDKRFRTKPSVPFSQREGESDQGPKIGCAPSQETQAEE